MARHKLTNLQSECIKELFPFPKATGRPSTDYRSAFNAILWILRTGSPFRDLPESFGKCRTIYELYDKWNSDGTLPNPTEKLSEPHLVQTARETTKQDISFFKKVPYEQCSVSAYDKPELLFVSYMQP